MEKEKDHQARKRKYVGRSPTTVVSCQMASYGSGVGRGEGRGLKVVMMGVPPLTATVTPPEVAQEQPGRLFWER
jgi:hypothetical protein